MAFSFRYTRYSAICHLILGGLCVIFGIADRATMYFRDAFHTEGVIAIWMGIWFFMTGFLGIFASQRVPNSERPRSPLVSTYLAFSIVATVFAGAMIICYAIGIAIIQNGWSCSEQTRNIRRCSNSNPYSCDWVIVSRADECRTSVGLGAMIIIFAAAEFGVGIWASICCCMGNNVCNCCCDTSSQQAGQVMYLQTPGGLVSAYVMTQGPNGMPVAVPVVTGGPVQMQAAGGQAYMMQNPQAAQDMTPPQHVQGGRQVHMMQNPHGAIAMTSQQVQGIPTSVDAQQQVVAAQHAFTTPATANKV